MYKLFSSASYLVRFWLAYITIEKISMFDCELANYFWGEVISVYTILMLISYFTAGKFYKKGETPPTVGVLIYFVIYCFFLFGYWLVLQFLTWIGILPIVT